MPLFVNKLTGALENVPGPTPDHEYPIISPEGQFGSVPADTYSQLLKEGYRAPKSEELQGELDYDKFSTPVEQAKTFVEGAAKSASLGASTGFETKVLGVNPEDIAKRKEVNPGTALAGDVAGVVASTVALPGGGLMQAGGKLATTSAVKLGVGKLGQRVARETVEGAIYQAGDEVSKAFIKDPKQTAESIAGNIGLSAVMSGAMGAAFHGGEKILAPVWNATSGSKTAAILNKIKDKAHETAGASQIDDYAKAAGIELDPVMRAAMSPEGQPIAQGLRESATPSGRKYQESLDAVHKDSSRQAAAAMGKTEKDIARVSELSDYDSGAASRDALVNEIDTAYAPVAKEYDFIRSRTESSMLDAELLPIMKERLAKIAIESGAVVRPGSDEALMMKNILKDVDNIKTLKDFDVFQSSVNSDLTSKQMFGLRSKVMKELRDQEDSAITRALGKDAPELMDSYATARLGYRNMMDKIDLVADRLRPGKFSGPKGFINSLKEMAPEDILRRLDVSKDVDLARHLEQSFPGALRSVKDAYLGKVLKKAVNAPRAVEGGLDTRVLFKQLDSLSPEMRDLLFTPEQQSMLKGVKGIVESLPERLNPSGTAKALDDRMTAAMGGVQGLVLGLLTGNPVAGAITGALAKLLGRDVPDAVRLSLLKVLGTDGPVDAVAFKSMVTAAEQAYKAAKTTKQIMRAIFKPGVGQLVVPRTIAQIDKLDKQLVAAQNNPEKAMEAVADYSPYLPEQAIATGALTANAVRYLTSLRPKTVGAAPLDGPRVPNAIEQARYHRALQIADQPAIVLQSLKDGSLTPDDIMDLGILYPALYAQYKEQVMEQIIDARDKGTSLPYKQIVSLGLFMQMPLESSTQPGTMAANQALQMSLQAQKQQPTQGGLEQLGDGVKNNLTQNQARRTERLNP